MDVYILTVVCGAALVAATWIVTRWGRLDGRAPEAVGTSFGANTGTTLRAVVVTLYAGAVGGILVAGFGGRLFMRVMAATSADSLHGVLTDAEEPIGRITFGGSAFLIVGGGLFGGVAVAVAVRLLRPWLPWAPWIAGAVSGVVALAALGGASGMLNPGNRDFSLLRPLWLAVALIVLGALGLGATVGALHARFDLGMPSLNGPTNRLRFYAPMLLFLPTVITIPVVLVVGLIGGVTAPAVASITASPAIRRWARFVAPTITGIAALAVTTVAIDVLALA